MTARVIDFCRPFNAQRVTRGLPPVADWGPVAWRNQAVGYALARGAMVYVWPRKRVGRLDSVKGDAAAMLRVAFADGAAYFPATEVHPIPFCLQFKPTGEIEEYLYAEHNEARESFVVSTPQPTSEPPHGGHAA